MSRGKIVIKKLEDKVKRQVTFLKRKKSRVKKAHELSVLCDVPIGLIIFSPSNRLYDFCSHSTSMKNLIMRYQMAKEGHATADHSFHPDHGSNCEKTESMVREIENLKLNLQFYKGHGLSLLTYEDLIRIELQLESSLQIARARKVDLMQQQQQKTDKLQGKRKEILMDEESHHLYDPGQGSSWEQLMWQAERQMTCHREDDDDVIRRQEKEFLFFGDEQTTGVLQLLRTPPSLPSNPGPSPSTGPGVLSPSDK